MKGIIRDFSATILAKMLRHFAFDPRYFNLWQKNGYHVLPVHFYSPIPDTSQINKSTFNRKSELIGINFNEEKQIKLLNEFQNYYKGEYDNFLKTKEAGSVKFFHGNGSIESPDAEILYCMVRHLKPKKIIEIGSGFSTIVSSCALQKNANAGDLCEFTAIEPYPSDYLKTQLSYPVSIIEKCVQEVSLQKFESLGLGDILFIDSSHVCKIGSDTQYEFLEILPRLKSGVLVHVHDIFFPFEYPFDWIKTEHRFWNEQYLLQAYLCGNNYLEVVWASAWMHANCRKRLSDAFSAYDHTRHNPASFWIKIK
jgi:hypothetical protein